MAKSKTPAPPVAPQNNTNEQEIHVMSDLAFFQEILAGTRSRTNSGAYVTEFLASGELGREVDLSSGSFAGKEPKKVKTALDNARKKMTEDGKLVIPEGINVAVRVKDDKVFIINTTLVAEAAAA
jgi:hypothetical protein